MLNSTKKATVDPKNFERLSRYSWALRRVGFPYDDEQVVMERADGKVCLMSEVVLGMADPETGERNSPHELFLADPGTGDPLPRFMPRPGQQCFHVDLAVVDQGLRENLAACRAMIEIHGGRGALFAAMALKAQAQLGMARSDALYLVYGVFKPILCNVLREAQSSPGDG